MLTFFNVQYLNFQIISRKSQTSLKFKVGRVQKLYFYLCKPDTQLYWKQLFLQLQILSFSYCLNTMLSCRRPSQFCGCMPYGLEYCSQDLSLIKNFIGRFCLPSKVEENNITSKLDNFIGVTF